MIQYFGLFDCIFQNEIDDNKITNCSEEKYISEKINQDTSQAEA